MIWLDIASIVFVSVTANHLGIVKAIEEVTERELPVVNCPKCCCFWLTLLYTVIVIRDVPQAFAISFLCSYLAIWFELLEGYVDTLYMKLYEKIYSDTSADETAASANKDNT